MGEFPDLARLPRACVAGDGRRGADGGRAGLDHDAACGEGARIRDRLSARLGGGPLSHISARSTRTAAPGSRRSGASPMSASPAPDARRKSITPPTGACGGCGRRRCRRGSSANCPPITSSSMKTEGAAAFGGYGVWPFRRVAPRVCLPLRHAGLAPGRGTVAATRARRASGSAQARARILEGHSQRRGPRSRRLRPDAGVSPQVWPGERRRR